MKDPLEKILASDDPTRRQWGQGGRYEIRDGVRKRVEEPTRMPDPNAPKEPPPEGEGQE